MLTALVQNIYDWDILVLHDDPPSQLIHRVTLCRNGLPCALAVDGGGNAFIRRNGEGSIACLSSNQCYSILITNVQNILCDDSVPIHSLLEADDSILYITNVKFSSCTSAGDGGAIRAYGGANVEIQDCEFIGCYSKGSGGAVSAVGATMLVSDSKFVNCSSDGSGGAIYGAEMLKYPADYSQLSAHIISSHFERCQSGDSGGAVQVNSGSLALSFSNVSDCTSAASGGAISAENGADLSISYSNFINNSAGGSGGGAFSVQESSSLLVGLICEANNAAAGGGGVLLWHGVNPPSFWCGAGAFNIRRISRDPNGPECLLCTAGTFQSSVGMMDESNCTACDLGTFSSAEGASVCIACPAGKYSTSRSTTSSNSCSSCDLGKFQSIAGKTSCELCDVGSYTNRTSSSVCNQCAAGTFLSIKGAAMPGLCALCVAGTFSDSGWSSCETCLPGTYMTQLGSASGDDCLECSAGEFSSTSSSTVCYQCKAGSFSFKGSSLCVNCTAGSFSGQKAAPACESCESGTYGDSNGATSCMRCPSGKFSVFERNAVNISCTSVGSIELCPTDISSVCSTDCARGYIGRYVQGGTYNANEGMTWIIGADGASSITLRFTEFKTEAIYDTLSLYSCNNNSCLDASIINSFSGLELPPDQISTTGFMQLVWSSDTCCPKRTSCYCEDPKYVFMLSGWQAEYEISGVKSCSLASSGYHRRNIVHSTSAEVSNKHSTTVPKRTKSNLHAAIAQSARVWLQNPRNKNTHISQSELQYISSRYQEGPVHEPNMEHCTGPLRIKTHDCQKYFHRSFNPFRVSATSVALALRSGRGISVGRQSYTMCGLENNAVYGNCLASSYKILEVLGMPTNSSPAFPGLPITVTVSKVDFYGQTIATDSSSLLQTLSAVDDRLISDHAVSLSGSIISILQRGIGTFTVNIKPTFTTVDAVMGITILKSFPAIYFKGLDAEMQTLSNMVSRVFHVAMPTGRSICPSGYILALDQQFGVQSRSGICTQCGTGTYSVDPLVGSSSAGPSCFSCPPSGLCKGGNSVQFSIGTWVIENGMYKLISCPPGHQLVNSIYGVFSHDAQDCRACKASEYILNPNSSSVSCQACPTGATCNGISLTGLVAGSEWKCDVVSGLCSLASCPPGYMLQQTSQLAQQCSICPASYYCVGGASASAQCPSGTFAPAGSNSSMACMSAVFISVVISLPVTKDQFSAEMQNPFQAALASAGGVTQEFVTIISVTPSRRSGSIQVSSTIAAGSASAAIDISSKLDVTRINSALIANGLPAGTLSSVTIMSPDLAKQSAFPVGMVVGISIGAFLSILLLILLGYFLTRKLVAQ